MNRRRVTMVSAIVIVAAIAAAGAVVAGRGEDPDAGPDSTVPGDRETATVRRQDLARAEELDGSIGRGDAAPLVLTTEGTLTDVPLVGDLLEPGDTVAEVDGRPVVALLGSKPQWRELGPSVDDGVDVLALEYALAALGYAAPHEMTVDEDWTSATTEAVEDFQDDHGLEDDGVLSLGEVVFVDGTVRVAAVEGSAGQPAAEAGITISDPTQVVNVDLPVDDSDLLAVDDEVEVELPTGETGSGTVTSIGAATTDDAGATTLPVTITVTWPEADGAEPIDGTPVTVNVDVAAATGVLTVPVEALLALAEGGYAVEVVDGASTRLVGVTIGVFADGLVEIAAGDDSELSDGDQVVIA